MENDLVYLRPNAVVEPLFDQWYAWAHLISPATAALNIKDRHLRIMNSYIQAPQIHAAAVKNPKLLGGPFMDYTTNKADAVRRLRDQTLERQGHMIEFADAIVALSKLLRSEAKGYSLDPLYPKVPEPLQGYVELVYDIHNQPSFRLFEPLLYESPYYATSSQSIALYLLMSDERPFILSTPHLEDSSALHLPVPFHDQGLDRLFETQRTGGSYREIRSVLGVPEEQDNVFRTLFTREAPEPYEEYRGKGIRTRYFGHACILMEGNGVRILVDPVISYGYETSLSRYTYANLPDEIDYVLITHNHQDHILFETILRLRHKVKNIVVPRNASGNLQDPSLKLMLKKLGFSNVIELEEMESVEAPGCTITGLPFLGEHADLDIRSKLCFHVSVGSLSVLFAADSCNVAPRVYECVHSIIGDIHVIFLGMECDGAPLSWVYNPLLPEPLARDKDQTRRLAGSNYERGMKLVEQFNPKEVYVYAMGQEPWLTYISSIKYTDESNPIIASNRLIETCNGRGIVGERLFGEKEIVY